MGITMRWARVKWPPGEEFSQRSYSAGFEAGIRYAMRWPAADPRTAASQSDLLKALDPPASTASTSKRKR